MTEEELRLECLKIAVNNKDIKIHDDARLGYDGIPFPTIVAEHIKHYVITGETKYSNAFLSFRENQTLVDTIGYEKMRKELEKLRLENENLKRKKNGIVDRIFCWFRL